jgi:hypothetical protein
MPGTQDEERREKIEQKRINKHYTQLTYIGLVWYSSTSLVKLFFRK